MIKRLNDQSGASIVIALLFFLICIAVGGVVVTAASVGASAVPREKHNVQLEYDVGCAAQALADQLGSAKVSVSMTNPDGIKTFTVTQVEGTDFARAFWEKQGNDLFTNYVQNRETTLSDVVIAGGSRNVSGTLTIDEHLNMTAKVSAQDDSSYAMTVFLQAIPTFDFSGCLKSIAYEEPVIQKTSDAGTRADAL